MMTTNQRERRGARPALSAVALCWGFCLCGSNQALEKKPLPTLARLARGRRARRVDANRGRVLLKGGARAARRRRLERDRAAGALFVFLLFGYVVFFCACF